MPHQAHNDIATWDTAVELSNVTKVFKQRRGGGSVLQNLLHPKFHTLTALDDVSLTVRRGEFLALAGPNGSGKSTTFKLLCGMIAPDSGMVRTCGMLPLTQRVPVMRQTGVLFGNRTELWWDHPVASSFTWKKAVWDIDDATYSRQFELVTQMLDLAPFMHTFARELSLGQRMRADLGLMLLHDPKLILLDEPTLGLDVLAKQSMIEFLKNLGRTGDTTIVVTSHDLDDLTQMAQRIVMLSAGCIAFDGTLAQLRQQTGDSRQVTITCPAPAPSLPACVHLESQENRHTYRFDSHALPISQLLSHLSRLAQVADVELEYAPIETVIAGLYKDWKREEEGVCT